MATEADDDDSLWFALFVNAVLVIVRVTVGVLSGSLTLLSAAADNFVDMLKVLVGLIASKVGRKQPTAQKTYGYGRATLLGALINSILAIALAGSLFYEAYSRITHPTYVHGRTVVIGAIIGIILNGVVALRLSKESHDLNKRILFVDMLFDSLASLGVLVSGILVLVTRKTEVDGIIAAALALFLLYNAWKVLRETTHILLDGVPPNINIERVRRDITVLKYVKSMNDLHIWGLSSTRAALSCRIVFNYKQMDKMHDHIGVIKLLLNDKHNITHATIEPELAGTHNDKGIGIEVRCQELK